MSTDARVKAAPSPDCSVTSPVTVEPPGTMNCTNGAGLPYVVETRHEAPVAVMARAHSLNVVKGAPLAPTPSNPIVHGPGGAAGSGDAVVTVVDAAVGATGVCEPPPQAPRPARRSTGPRGHLRICGPPALSAAYSRPPACAQAGGLADGACRRAFSARRNASDTASALSGRS